VNIIRLEIHPMTTNLIGRDDDIKKYADIISEDIDIPVENYQFSFSYQNFGEIPVNHFYNKKSNSFPTGLLETVKGLLKVNNLEYDIVDKRPKGLFTNDDVLTSPMTLGGRTTEGKYSYQLDAINSIIKSNGKGILNLSVGSGKTLLFSALAKIALPHLNDGEHILFFTSSKEIFKQTLKEVGDMTGQEVGYYASNKYKDRPIMIVMLQSAYALYKIDPYKGLKLTPKERELRKIKDVILPKISNGNSINALKAYLRFMKLDTKVAKNFKEMLENEIDTSGSDKELLDKLNAYADEFDSRIEDKAKDSKEKKDFIVNLLNSAVFICNDECQHLTAESYYKVILACQNALVCVGLSGSLDPKNKLLQQRVKAIFEKITYRVKLVDNVKRGVSVKPIIHMLSINSPKNISGLREWQEVYSSGIVHNEYRNNLIAKLVAEKAYPSGRVTLIIVNQIDHGNDLLKRLTDLGIPAVFIYGQSDDEYRRKSIQAMRDNKVKVAIATSILDEGVDVKTIKVLILAAAGKSYRTTIQRIGRSVRLGEFNDAHIFDFFDNQNYMLSRQSLERMNIYKEQQLEIKENK